MAADTCIACSDNELAKLLTAHAAAEARQGRLVRLRDRAIRLAMLRAERRALAESDSLIDALLADRACTGPMPSQPVPLPPGFSDFRRAMSLLHRTGQADRPVAARRVAGALSPRDAARVEALEAAAAHAADRLSMIEGQALETPPATAREATAKLRFLSALMLAGGPVEVDYFAWLVDECARVIEAGQG